jgi:hypothetical protein
MYARLLEGPEVVVFVDILGTGRCDNLTRKDKDRVSQTRRCGLWLQKSGRIRGAGRPRAGIYEITLIQHEDGNGTITESPRRIPCRDQVSPARRSVLSCTWRDDGARVSTGWSRGAVSPRTQRVWRRTTCCRRLAVCCISLSRCDAAGYDTLARVRNLAVATFIRSRMTFG